jgi:CheY-like chemotaxis protein
MSQVYKQAGASDDDCNQTARYFLLIEDNKGDILLTREALDEIGMPYTLRVIRDGEQAYMFLQSIAKKDEEPAPDLILLDINLPRLNGHELLAYIKQHEDLRQIPVLMFTTSNAHADIAKAYQNHANCYITKPTEAEEFMQALKTIEHFWNDVCQLPGDSDRSANL